jgi:hypothetical protein
MEAIMTARTTKVSFVPGIALLAGLALGPVSMQGVALAENQPLVYRAYMDTTEPIPSVAGSSETPALPSTLVIAPGRYAFLGKTYDLQKQGLYRFSLFQKENQQRIVYDKKHGDVDAVLSAIAWMVSHGNSDNGKSADAWTQKALTSKLFITCGGISGWACYIMTPLGIRVRTVSSLTLDEWNSYDNGHSIMEVYREDFKKWVLYDVDENACFFDKTNPLSLLELSERAASGDYQIKSLAADSMMDVSNFKVDARDRAKADGFDLAFFMEQMQSENGRRLWYARALQVPMIGGCFCLTTPSEANRKRVESYCKGAKYLEKDEFVKKFY